MTACSACDTVQSSNVSIALRRAGAYGGDFKTKSGSKAHGAGQPSHDFADVGQKLKHDGTLGFISRGAARRSGLNPAGWHRYVPIAVVVAVVVIALAALGYAGGGAAVR